MLTQSREQDNSSERCSSTMSLRRKQCLVLFVFTVALFSIFSTFGGDTGTQNVENQPFDFTIPLATVVPLRAKEVIEEKSDVVPQDNLTRARLLPSQRCFEPPAFPPIVSFKQVQTYVGPVAISDIRHILKRIREAFVGNPMLLHPASGDNLELVLFAVDGTLLNLLRWGRVVNDDDVDVGFFFRFQGNGSILQTKTPIEQYQLLVRWLFAQQLLGDVLQDRTLRHLHNSKRDIKPRRCWHRGQFMQCRFDDTNVHIDIFGPETLFSSLTNLSVYDVLPIQQCAAWESTFMCPINHVKALTQFTIDHGKKGKSEGPRTWYEFSGCALFPRKAAERTGPHLRSIIQTSQLLNQCGFPNLLDQLNNISPFFEIECQKIMN